MAKRASIKGKGLDVFNIPAPGEELPEVRETAPPEIKEIAPPESNKTAKSGKDLVKETFYLPREVSQELDEVWMELRRTTKRVSKSGMVALALESMIRRHKINHQNSELSEWVAGILAKKG